MQSWVRVASVVQLLLVELFAIFCLAAVSARLIARHGALGCPAQGGGLDVAFFLGLGVGLLAAAYVLVRIFRPRELDQSVRPVLNIGPVAVVNPTIDAARYSFSSTHPAYALLDLSCAIPFFFVYLMGQHPPAYAGCGATFSYLLGRIALGLVLVFPAIRLFAWFVLGRRVAVASHWETTKPILLFLGLTLPIYLSIPLMVYVPLWRAPRVDSQSFAGGLGAHPELAGRTVRLVGTLVPATAVRCVCSERDPLACRVAAVRIDLGPAGDVIARGVSSDADALRALAERPDIKAGREVTLYGTLGPLPTPPKDPQKAAAERLDCGFQELGAPPAAGRAYLKAELP